MNQVSEARFERRKGQKTFTHFLKLGRIPTEYEIVSTKLTYNTEGFSVNTPVTRWYETYREGSPLKCSDWDLFADPRQTIYRSYNELQYRQETYLDFVLDRIETDGYDEKLSDEWLDVLRLMLGPYRYPAHAMQMIAAYFAHLAPSSRITNCAAFQAADSMRIVQRIAYRETQLNKSRGQFAECDRSNWEDNKVWQPLRECIERLMCVWDWAEAFVALNIVLKPLIDSLFITELSDFATENGDSRLSDFLYSFSQDSAWSRDWSRVLIKTSLDDRPENREVIEGWVQKWLPMVQSAVEGFAPVFDNKKLKTRGFDQYKANIDSRYALYLHELGLASPVNRQKKVA